MTTTQPATSRIKPLALSEINIEGGTQSRDRIETDVVTEYAEAMKAGSTFPPLTIFWDGVVYWLGDGFHRFHAATSAGLKKFDCDIRKGTQRDAILFSFGANANHGLRRSNATKRKIIDKMLSDEEWSKKSIRWIADVALVSPNFVSERRKLTSSDDGRSQANNRPASDGKSNPANKKAAPKQLAAGSDGNAHSEPDNPTTSEEENDATPEHAQHPGIHHGRQSIVPRPPLIAGRRYVTIGHHRDDPSRMALMMVRPHPIDGFWYVETHWTTDDTIDFTTRAVELSVDEVWNFYTDHFRQTEHWSDQEDDIDEPWNDSGHHAPVRLVPRRAEGVPRPALEANTSYSLEGANDDALEVWPCDKDETTHWKMAHICGIKSKKPTINFDTKGGPLSDRVWDRRTENFTPAPGAEWLSAPVTEPKPWWEGDKPWWMDAEVTSPLPEGTKF